VTRDGVHDGIAYECRALSCAGVAPTVAADVGHGVGAVAASGVGESREDAGLNFGDVEDCAPCEAHARKVSQQHSNANQNYEDAHAGQDPNDEGLAVRAVRAGRLR
jgi:hypothetical protein